MKLLRLSWDGTAKLCERLASSVSASGFRPGVIVGISRGGLVPARLLSDILGISGLYVIRVSFYTGVGRAAAAPEILQPLPSRLGGKRVLLVDDVSDTGKSLAVAKRHVQEMGAAEVRVATLHFKPRSEFRPDFFVEETDAWIVYPWERHEAAKELGKKVSEL
ncbi:MAG: phosphoribosyltransferase [Candidatus Micrarchaeota archaeon]